MSAVDCVWDAKCQLGEGPIWFENALWFTDIKQKKVHRFDPATGASQSWDAPSPPGFIAPFKSGRFIAGTKSGLYDFDAASGAFTLIRTVEPERPDNRLNDGAVDSKGRLWFGSMDDAEGESTGKLYRFDRNGLVVMDDDYVITNGPAFSPDGRTLYHTDTLKKIIYAFDWAADGSLSNRREFVHIEEGAGYPDGPVVDAEGCLWTGLFMGWGVRRYSPRGELLTTIRFPVSNVTKIVFGGDKLTTVYATTAWKDLDAAARIVQPLAGGVFRFEIDVPGLPQCSVNYG